MNTGNLIIHPMAKHHSAGDENSNIPVNLLKTQETLVEKRNHRTKTVHVYKNSH